MLTRLWIDFMLVVEEKKMALVRCKLVVAVGQTLKIMCIAVHHCDQK